MSSRRTSAAGRAFWAGLVLVTVPALSACSSSSELARLETKLDDVQVLLLQLQKEAATGADVSASGSAVGERLGVVSAAQATLAEEVRALTRQVGELEAKLEETHFRLAQLSQQIAATNQELQAMRSASESRVPPPRSAPEGTTDPQSLYDTAYDDYLNGNYDLAILGFQQYLESFSTSNLADNATYWIGECYYRQGKLPRAVEQFDAVLDRFPRGDRIASALLKKGYALLELGQRAQGVVQLQNVLCNYPGSDEARIARQRLEELGIDVDC